MKRTYLKICVFFLLPSIIHASTLTLDDIVSQFLNNNYDLQIAKQEIDKSKADLITAKQRPNPILSGSYSYLDPKNHLSDVNPVTPALFTVHLDHPIELGNKRQHRVQAAQEGIIYANNIFEETKREQLFNLIQAYYQVQADKANLDDAIADQKDFKTLLVIAQSKFDHGFLSQIDLDKLRLQAIDYDNNVHSNQSVLFMDKEALAFLLSMDVQNLNLAPLTFEKPYEKSVEELIQFAQTNRADCVAAIQNIKLSKANVLLEKANAIPDITVGAELENYAPSYSDSLLGISFSIPLPIYDRNEGAIEKAQVVKMQAQTTNLKIQNQAASEVKQAYAQYQAQKLVYVAMENGFKSAKSLKEKQEKIFALKGISILDLLDAQKSYREYQAKRLKALIDLHTDLAVLKLSSGLSLIDKKEN